MAKVDRDKKQPESEAERKLQSLFKSYALRINKLLNDAGGGYTLDEKGGIAAVHENIVRNDEIQFAIFGSKGIAKVYLSIAQDIFDWAKLDEIIEANIEAMRIKHGK